MKKEDKKPRTPTKLRGDKQSIRKRIQSNYNKDNPRTRKKNGGTD